MTWINLIFLSGSLWPNQIPAVGVSRDQNKSKMLMFRHDECRERQPFRHDVEDYRSVSAPRFHFSPQMCFPDLSDYLTGFLQRLCTRFWNDNSEMISKETSIHRGILEGKRLEHVTCSMSADSLRRWAMSSDSVSRSLRRPDLYSWPTSSLWRLSFTWLTRKCITAFGTLRREGGGREGKQTGQMVENKDARWPGDCVAPQMEGAGCLTHQVAESVEICSCWSTGIQLKAIYLSLLSSGGPYTRSHSYGKAHTLEGWKKSDHIKTTATWLHHSRYNPILGRG